MQKRPGSNRRSRPPPRVSPQNASRAAGRRLTATEQRLPPREAQPPASRPHRPRDRREGKAARAAPAAPTCSPGGVSAGALGSHRGGRAGGPASAPLRRAPRREPRGTAAGGSAPHRAARPAGRPTGSSAPSRRAVPPTSRQRRRRPSMAAASLPGPAGPAPAPSPPSGRTDEMTAAAAIQRGGGPQGRNAGGRRLPAGPFSR